MQPIRIVGIDGGLAALGIASVEFDTGGAFQKAYTRLFETKKETKKRKLHVGSDDARRIDALSESVLRFLRATGPDIVAYELPAAAKGARAGHALGIAHALVRCTVRQWSQETPIVEVTVGDARKAVCPDPKRPTEEEVHAVLRHAVRGWDGWAGRDVSTHELDAVAVAYAAFRTSIAAAVRSQQP